MKLLLEATVAGKSDVLAAGMVRVNVTGVDSGKSIGKLTMTVDLWEWIRDWITAANNLGVPGIEIQVQEIEHRPEAAGQAKTMRGRLLEAVQIAAGKPQSPQDANQAPGVGKGSRETPEGKISPLWREFQSKGGGKR